MLRCFASPSISCGPLVGRLKLGWVVRLCLLGYRLEIFVVVLGEEGYVAHLERARLLLWLTSSLNLGSILSHPIGLGCRDSLSAHWTKYLVVIFSHT